MTSLERCVSHVHLVQASERVYNIAQTLQDTADVLHEGGEDAAAASNEASQELEVSSSMYPSPLCRAGGRSCTGPWTSLALTRPRGVYRSQP